MKTAMKTPSDLFKAFADSTRLRILSLLLEGELCVCDLCEVLDIIQPTVSRHLGRLQRDTVQAGESGGDHPDDHLASTPTLSSGVTL